MTTLTNKGVPTRQPCSCSHRARSGTCLVLPFVKPMLASSWRNLAAHTPEAHTTMRNRSPRSFTVETKSGGRQRPIIPHRAVAPVAPRPAVSWPPPAEPYAATAEPRRILPSLITPEPMEAEPESVQGTEERSPKPRRGRPPTAKPIAAEVVKEPIAEPAVEVTPPAPAPQAPRLARAVKPPAALSAGERWKRRLGRWAR
jgi:hypothetical protein